VSEKKTPLRLIELQIVIVLLLHHPLLHPSDSKSRITPDNQDLAKTSVGPNQRIHRPAKILFDIACS